MSTFPPETVYLGLIWPDSHEYIPIGRYRQVGSDQTRRITASSKSRQVTSDIRFLYASCTLTEVYLPQPTLTAQDPSIFKRVQLRISIATINKSASRILHAKLMGLDHPLLPFLKSQSPPPAPDVTAHTSTRHFSSPVRSPIHRLVMTCLTCRSVRSVGVAGAVFLNGPCARRYRAPLLACFACLLA